jgi:hypothetical protein
MASTATIFSTFTITYVYRTEIYQNLVINLEREGTNQHAPK